ncbi:universal stress protein F [Rhizobium sp. SG_E_25_P2]|uniref:universal stress protein n=1 Tax=Rhizobium sp. SG_E_25_P2 TaxID=2879942 RepID=UPI00247628AB|nr:universal stress protein [Rhizobium sp. SG_E_25_P2]MDH6269124.1 universal stress protein F [Rhizobium sp. SG_E_25_P2]
MYKKILVPVDIGQLDKGEKILLKAMEIVDDGGAILLLNVAEDIPGYITIELPVDFIEASIKEAGEQLSTLNEKTGAKALILTRIGSPAREILAAAEENGADLVIIASHRPDFSNYLLGSTADRVVRHAKCSVLVDR